MQAKSLCNWWPVFYWRVLSLISTVSCVSSWSIDEEQERKRERETLFALTGVDCHLHWSNEEAGYIRRRKRKKEKTLLPKKVSHRARHTHTHRRKWGDEWRGGRNGLKRRTQTEVEMSCVPLAHNRVKQLSEWVSVTHRAKDGQQFGGTFLSKGRKKSTPAGGRWNWTAKTVALVSLWQMAWRPH